MKRFYVFALLSLLVLPLISSAQQIQYAGQRANLSVALVSGITIEIKLSPLGSEEPFSEVLVDYPREEIFNSGELAEPFSASFGQLNLDILPSPLRVVITRDDGTVVQQLVLGGESGSVEFNTDAPVFGLGHGGPQFDRRGEVFPMRDGWGVYERPTHGSRVAAPMIMGADGWSMFFHHPISSGNVFDLSQGNGRFIPDPEKLNIPLKLFITAWQQPEDVFTQYRLIAGETPMPPKWALGYMQSHRTLDSRDEILQVAYNFRARNIPADAVIYLGTGFTPSGWNRGHGNFEFNEDVFDDPEEIFSELKDLNFNVVLHTYSPPEGLHGSSMEEESDDPVHIRNYWLDNHEDVFKLGVDGWWPDGGEPLSSESRVARYRMYWEGPLYSRPNTRPWNINRTGYSGVHRYGGWLWSGDPDSYWETLETQIAVGLNHVVSLTPFWGVDIGGFLPSVELTGELYVRWMQFSVFTASMRGHGRAWHLRLPWGWNTGQLGPAEVDAFSDAFEDGYPDPEELRNALVEPIVREYLQLRYRLIPYTYTLFRETHDRGIPPMRAMWLEFEDDDMAVGLSDQFMWGSSLLVAPVYEKGAEYRTLYLPQGRWYDFWTNETHTGGGEVTRQVDLGTLPLFVREGSIVPMDPVRQYMEQEVDDHTTIRIYPGDDAMFSWYQDDGKSQEYLGGEYSWTLLTWDDQARVLTIEPDPASEGRAPEATTLRIKLIGDNVYTEDVTEVDWQERRRTERPYRMQLEKIKLVEWDGTRMEVVF